MAELLQASRGSARSSERPALLVVVVAAVEHVVDSRWRASTIHTEKAPNCEITPPGPLFTPGTSLIELDRVAAVERQFFNTTNINDFLDGRMGCFNLGDSSFDRHSFRNLADLEFHRNLAADVGVETKRLRCEGAEAVNRNLYDVRAGGCTRKVETAGLIGLTCRLDAGELVDGLDIRTGHNGPSAIRYRTYDEAGSLPEN